MTQFFARQRQAFRNDLNRSFASLVGIAQGLICDDHLSDREIQFLEHWLVANETISCAWPGDVIFARVRDVLRDGVVTEAERAHLVEILQQLIGGTFDELSDATHVAGLALDVIDQVQFDGKTFCLTGNFVFAPRPSCEEAIESRGGAVVSSVSKKLDYLVVGGLGSPEWKHGSFGFKIEKAVALQRDGARLLIVHEDPWAHSLSVAGI